MTDEHELCDELLRPFIFIPLWLCLTDQQWGWNLHAPCLLKWHLSWIKMCYFCCQFEVITDDGPPDPDPTVEEKDDDDFELEPWAIALISVAGVGILGGGAYMIYRKQTSSKSKWVSLSEIFNWHHALQVTPQGALFGAAPAPGFSTSEPDSEGPPEENVDQERRTERLWHTENWCLRVHQQYSPTANTQSPPITLITRSFPKPTLPFRYQQCPHPVVSILKKQEIRGRYCPHLFSICFRRTQNFDYQDRYHVRFKSYIVLKLIPVRLGSHSLPYPLFALLVHTNWCRGWGVWYTLGIHTLWLPQVPRVGVRYDYSLNIVFWLENTLRSLVST